MQHKPSAYCYTKCTLEAVHSGRLLFQIGHSDLIIKHLKTILRLS